ncbi:MAG: hypothetical protein JXA67_06485, partial [Micromonosporaceae bacterium]|nr:hypothetical protein [Micromonosporaceae bacterium]
MTMMTELGAAAAAPTGAPETGAPVANDRMAELIDAAGGDARARRRLLDRASRVLAADAEAERRSRAALAEAQQRARAAEADAESRVRAAEARLRVQERERTARRAEREAQRSEQAASRQERAELAADRRARWAGYRETASAAAPAALSMLVYSAAVASAVFGQVSVATGRYGWPIWRALVLAGFIELMALAMATTANRLRLAKERALAPRVLTWVFASFAAAVNVWGHWGDPLMAVGLGAASVGGITLWEIRSSARHRAELRAVGQIAEPLAPLGLRFWVLHPGIAATAYSLGVRTRVSPSAAPLVAQAEAVRAARAGRRGWRVAAALVSCGGLAVLAAGAVLDPTRVRSPWLAAALAVNLGVLLLAAAGRGRATGAPAQDDATQEPTHPAQDDATQEPTHPAQDD